MIPDTSTQLENNETYIYNDKYIKPFFISNADCLLKNN